MYNQHFSLFLLLDWIQPGYKRGNIFKKIDKRAAAAFNESWKASECLECKVKIKEQK